MNNALMKQQHTAVLAVTNLLDAARGDSSTENEDAGGRFIVELLITSVIAANIFGGLELCLSVFLDRDCVFVLSCLRRWTGSMHSDTFEYEV